MDKDLKDLLFELNFFSELPAGKKINLDTMKYEDADSYLVPIGRCFCPTASRKLNMKRAEELLTRSIRLLKLYKGTPSYNVIIKYLDKFKSSIFKNKLGYIEDPKIISEIEVLVTAINLKLDKYKINDL